MTVHHHPGEEILLAYASGDLAEPLALVVATHLALCPECRTAVDRLEILGGVLLERVGIETGNVAFLERAIDAAIARAARLPDTRGLPRASAPSDRLFPQPLLDYVGGGLDRVAWKTLAPGIRHAIVARNAEGATGTVAVGRTGRLDLRAHTPRHRDDGGAPRQLHRRRPPLRARRSRAGRRDHRAAPPDRRRRGDLHLPGRHRRAAQVPQPARPPAAALLGSFPAGAHVTSRVRRAPAPPRRPAPRPHRG